MEDRDKDKKHFLLPENSRKQMSMDWIKSLYIAEGKAPDEIALISCLPEKQILEIIKTENLAELRKSYMIKGLDRIKNIQLNQANKLLDLENNFKKLRILQLEAMLKDTILYFERHGDFAKRHPISGEILKNTDGIPMQIKIPNVSKELMNLKESVNISTGMEQLLAQIDTIMHSGKPDDFASGTEDPDAIDVDFSEIFKTGED